MGPRYRSKKSSVSRTSATRGILGGIDPGTGFAFVGHEYNPGDVRGAMLLAAGIDPFGQDGFRHEDFSSSLRASVWSEEAVRDRLVECAFGL